MKVSRVICVLAFAGLALPSAAQVSDAGVLFNGHIDFLDAGGRADSLNVSGGMELLPFSDSISASTNVPGDSAMISGSATWDASGSLGVGGSFSSDFALSTSYGGSGFPSDPQGIISFASVQYDLLLNESSQLNIDIDVSADSTSIFLVKVDGTTIFDSDVLPPSSASYEIDVPAGDIQVLFGNSISNLTASVSESFFSGSITVVPAPASAVAIGLAGLVATRRRR